MRPSRIYEPFQIGKMKLRNRIVAPPHAAQIGDIVGPADSAERYISYWESLAEGGTAMVVALNGFVENILPPGFDPTGVGARTTGVFRDPLFVERMGELARRVQAHGTCASTQLIMQGGMPHGPSPALSGPVINYVPHALTRREIAWFINEYRVCAEQALAAGLDGIELHANHDDLLEWFLSPLTNLRSDHYGGSFERRMAFLCEVLAEIRQGVGDNLAIGVRLNMEEAEPGGYDRAGGLEIAQWLQASGLIDYLHLVMGTGWGFPSYIQTPHFEPGHWAEMAGAYRKALDLPIIYAGRVNQPEIAEQILAAGHADLVAVGRAHLADPQFVTKGKGDGQGISRLRPCIGTNDCINRIVAEGLPFACAANPSLGAGDRHGVPKAASRKTLLVVGGGPAGMQLAITAAERGHSVQLWEQAAELGGQMLLATRLPGNQLFTELVEYQKARLIDLGVTVHLGRTATAEEVLASGSDAIAFATGAVARRPEIPGTADQPDMWMVLRGQSHLGKRVGIVVQEDHLAPLAFADMLGRDGHEVTMFIQTNGPAPLLGRYSVGAYLGRLSEAGVRLICTEAVTSVSLPDIRTRNVYSRRETVHEGFDSVVLACGGTAQDQLYRALEDVRDNVHVLGDAFAPRRLVFATKQAYMLAKAI